MDFFSSQETEFFDTPEEIVEDRGQEQDDINIDSPHSDSISPFRRVSSQGASETPDQVEQILIMQLFPPSSEKSYVTVKALMEDVNKTASRQGYNVVMKGRNRKDKNGDLRKVKLGCTKGGEYKENVGEIGEVR